MIDFAERNELKARIKVFGIGGAGGNALNNMIQQNLSGVMFHAANTDAQALNSNLAPVKIQIGSRLTGGLGAGGNPKVGQDSAIEDNATLADQFKDADMVFVTAGMGGGTGTGAAPVIAQLAREAGALTVGIVTKPFTFEGLSRRRNAERGLEALARAVDTLIVIPNDRLLDIADEKMSMINAFQVADRVLFDAVKSISDIIVTPGLINVDFADVKAIMSEQGRALMGTGHASGPGRAIEAAKMAVSSPLLEDANIEGATGILINITGGPDMTLHEVNEAAMLIQESAHEEANIIFGAVIDDNIKDIIKITVVATGFDQVRRDTRSRHDVEDLVSDDDREEMAEYLERATPAPAVNRFAPPQPQRMSPPPLPTQAQRPATSQPAAQTSVGSSSTQRRQPKRDPLVFNPFAEPTKSEYDTPTYARRGRRTTAVETSLASTLWDNEDSGKPF